MSDPVFKSHATALVESQTIGEGTSIWAFCHVMPGAVIGSGCNIGDHCYIEGGSKIGDRVTVKNGVSIWDGVTLEDDVFVGPNAVFTNDLLPVSRNTDFDLKTTVVDKGTAIGANATIVCGHRVGKYVLIGAGSVVVNDIPDYALVVGNPGKVQGFICRCRKRLHFENAAAGCSCGKKYTLQDQSVSEVV